jgi:hypothetical protein
VTDDEQWQSVIERFTAVLGSWSKRHLTLQGRITVLKTLALSTLTYVASVCPAPTAVIERIDRATVAAKIKEYPLNNFVSVLKLVVINRKHFAN